MSNEEARTPLSFTQKEMQPLFDLVTKHFERREGKGDVIDSCISLYCSLLSESRLREKFTLQEIAEFAVRQIFALSNFVGGRSFYFPKMIMFRAEIHDRNMRIADEYRGNNVREIGLKYGVSYVRVRQIINDPKYSATQLAKHKALKASNP